ncbi:MAG: F0F1 ATP synthase subunit B [Bacteroidetes bacterium]|jgi:F-type H+-transporting ATPase subunit b|nr:F0F1 ATP synthase subunit B [Bacteroidota bacterium]
MGLVMPDIGLVIWMSITFLIVLFLLKKFAWGPILKMIHEREASIEEALKSAERAKAEMQALQADNERIIAEARQERDRMMKEARDMKDAIVGEAKSKAKEEADKMLAIARETIHNEKMAAITDLKNQVAQLSIDVAEKILKRELAAESKQKELLGDLMKDVKLN